jgi:dienelactone hydrolase
VVGLRTRDVLAGVEYLKSRAEVDPKRISVIGHGSGGLLALYAASLDDTIYGAAVTRALVSYGSVVESEIYTHRYSMFPPGALRKYDLPELAGMVAPRRLLVINAVDAVERPLEAERAAEAYRPAREVFGVAGGELRVERAFSAAEIAGRYREWLRAGR